MARTHRNILNALLAMLIVSASLSSNRAAAAICKNLPPSKLLVFHAKAEMVEEEKPPVAALNQHIPAEAFASQHTMMLTIIDLIAWFDIKHRTVTNGDGSVCDSPELVRLGFGSGHRKILVADAIADDNCVRRQMLDHEAAHAAAFDSTVDRFIDERRTYFERGMKALKQTPAPSPEVATERWNQGLRIIMIEAKRQLMTELRAASTGVDDPAVLTALKMACNGKIRELEMRGSANP